MSWTESWAPSTRAERFRIYNLGTHQAVAMRDLIAIIEGALNKRARVTY